MTLHVQKPGGPFEDFKKRFAFTDAEYSRALRITGTVYPDFSEGDIAQSSDSVHALLFEASKEHPLELGRFDSLFKTTDASGFASSLLLAGTFPRWKMEGLIEEGLNEGEHASVNAVFWPVKK